MRVYRGCGDRVVVVFCTHDHCIVRPICSGADGAGVGGGGCYCCCGGGGGGGSAVVTNAAVAIYSRQFDPVESRRTAVGRRRHLNHHHRHHHRIMKITERKIVYSRGITGQPDPSPPCVINTSYHTIYIIINFNNIRT